jgi:methionine--tRNA ligase beta chain
VFATIDDLVKLNLRIGTIKTVEPVEGSEKLLKLQVDLGEEQRQILSGIAKWYTPEDLIGKQVVIVANLAPRSMMGLESEGMILCANNEEGPVLLSPVRPVESGASVQ